MEVIVGPQDGPSQKLIDELEVRYICLPVWVHSGHIQIRGLCRQGIERDGSDLLGCDAATHGGECLVF